MATRPEQKPSIAPIVGPDDERRFTDSGIEVKHGYDAEDVEPGLEERLGEPGEYPFTRGIHPDMYRGRTWTMRQYAGYASAKETNERFHYLIDHGSTGLSMAFDLPTQLGRDSDDPLCMGEVGRTGVAIDTIDDMHRVFDGIPLDQVSTSMTINATATTLLAMYVVVAEERGIARDKLSGTIQNDILKEYIARGLDVDVFAPRLSFFFNAHIDFFEEVAKYRAARRIWAREMRERYGAKNPRSWLMRFHTQTAGVSLTAQQPEVNIVRTALEALSAVLGGTQSLHTNSFDEALALPTENAVRLALRTQQVIAHETGVVNTIDPLGGSYFVEDLTNRLETEAYEYFDRIRALGGVIPAIKENFFQREIADASFRYQSEVEAKQRIIVGVNRYQQQEDTELELLRIDPALETKQIERVTALRARRDSAKVEETLAALRRGAEGDENLMPLIVEASRAYVTMGEMCDTLREVWGVWRETPVF